MRQRETPRAFVAPLNHAFITTKLSRDIEH